MVNMWSNTVAAKTNTRNKNSSNSATTAISQSSSRQGWNKQVEELIDVAATVLDHIFTMVFLDVVNPGLVGCEKEVAKHLWAYEASGIEGKISTPDDRVALRVYHLSIQPVLLFEEIFCRCFNKIPFRNQGHHALFHTALQDDADLSTRRSDDELAAGEMFNDGVENFPRAWIKPRRLVGQHPVLHILNLGEHFVIHGVKGLLGKRILDADHVVGDF